MPTELEQLRERVRCLEAVNAAALSVHASLEPRESLRQLVAEAVQLTRASSGSLVLRNPNSSLLEIEAAIGLPAAATVLRLPLGRGITGWVSMQGRPARVGDVRRDPRYLMVRPEVRSELAVPVVIEGEVRGVLNVDSEQLDAFSESDEAVLDELARHAAVVIRNTWLFEQARRKTALLTSLAGIAQAMNQAYGLTEVLHLITREAVHLMGAKLSSLLLITDEANELEVRASYGAGPDYLGRGRLNLDDSLVGVVVRRRKPLQIEDVRSSRLYQSTEVARREGLVSLLSVPLTLNQEARGALNVYTSEPHTFSNEEIQTLLALAELSAIALERARLGERMVLAEEQLRQSDKLCALGLLAAEVAHEIRNPLTVMKMLYHSLDLQFPDGDPRHEDVRLIGQKMDHLNRIVEQILDFARHAEPRLEMVSVSDLVDDLRLLTRHKLRAQNVELALDVPASVPRFRADPIQLEQAFLNLLLNAVEAMPSGGRLAISARVEPPEGGAAGAGDLIVLFTDTGNGMPLPPGGGRPVSFLGSTKPRGTGLGLAIVTRVVEGHRGRIRFESTSGKGTTVTLRFPLDAESEGTTGT
ncbi:MAG: GAF domain-containing protein [Verrucomicrobiales bacterium]|nr:GAF domain-containing protein [Verrucomicrobiales bacterium]